MSKRVQPVQPITHEMLERVADEPHLFRTRTAEFYFARMRRYWPELYEQLRPESRPYLPRFGETDQKWRDAQPTNTRVNYAAEVDGRSRAAAKGKSARKSWPEVLHVEDGEGDVMDLTVEIAAKYGAAAVDCPEHWYLPNCHCHWDSPGNRVLGRADIARYLGIGRTQLSERIRADRLVGSRIFKIGDLMVSTRSDLAHVASRLNELAHKSMRRKPKAASAPKRMRFRVAAAKQVM